MSTVVIAFATLAILSGCESQNPHGRSVLPENGPLRAREGTVSMSVAERWIIMNSSDWEMSWRESEESLYFAKINIKGGCHFDGSWMVPRRFRSSPFEHKDSNGMLDAGTCEQIREIIAGDAFNSLNSKYFSRIEDMRSIEVTIHVNGKYYSVASNGYFPEPIRELAIALEALRHD